MKLALTSIEEAMRSSLMRAPRDVAYIRKDWLIYRGAKYAKILRGIRRRNLLSGDVSYTFENIHIDNKEL